MIVKVKLTPDAKNDIRQIETYLEENESEYVAGFVIAKITKEINSLAKFPHRGGHPNELLLLGNSDYREIRYKKYRIVHHFENNGVIIDMIIHSSRNAATIFRERLSNKTSI